MSARDAAWSITAGSARENDDAVDVVEVRRNPDGRKTPVGR
jgi:hypothetical protein